MNFRAFFSLCIISIVATALTVPVTTHAQEAPYSPPRTPWGDPDIQGIWPGNTGVPMQRSEDLGERTTLTDEEFAERAARIEEQAAGDLEEFVTSDRVGLGPPSYWTERGRAVRETSLIIDPPNGRLPELTVEALRYRDEARDGRGLPGAWQGEADRPEDMNIYYRCITRGLLGSVIPVIYNNGNQILQAPGYVVFRNEMIHESRIIPLDSRPHVNSDIKMYMGDSRGHWEGDTLVVETRNFTDKVAIGSNGAGYPGGPGYHSEDLVVTERFTRLSDDTLSYTATIEDDKTWVEPWTLQIRLDRDDDYKMFEYACHEANYAMYDILSGARAEEAAAEAAEPEE
jgi:hypothetical protein